MQIFRKIITRFLAFFANLFVFSIRQCSYPVYYRTGTIIPFASFLSHEAGLRFVFCVLCCLSLLALALQRLYVMLMLCLCYALRPTFGLLESVKISDRRYRVNIGPMSVQSRSNLGPFTCHSREMRSLFPFTFHLSPFNSSLPFHFAPSLYIFLSIFGYFGLILIILIQ